MTDESQHARPLLPDDPPPSVVPSPNPATSALLMGMTKIVDAVDNVALNLQRRENLSPGLFRITPAGSAMGLDSGAVSHRIRVETWVIAVSAAGVYGVQVGSAVVAQVNMTGAGTMVIPLPITIDSGKDITTSGTAANITDSFLLGFTE